MPTASTPRPSQRNGRARRAGARFVLAALLLTSPTLVNPTAHSDAGAATGSTPLAASDPAGQQVLPWFVRVTGVRGCYGALIDDLWVLTVRECLDLPYGTLMFPRDPSATGLRVGVRSATSADLGPSGRRSAFALLTLRKLGLRRDYPALGTVAPRAGSTLFVEYAPSDGAPGGASVPVTLVTVPRPGSLQRVVLDPPAREASGCPDAPGVPLLVRRGEQTQLLGLVTDVSRCGRDGTLTVALLAPELEWLTSAAVCVRQQQLMISDHTGIPSDCRYRLSRGRA